MLLDKLETQSLNLSIINQDDLNDVFDTMNDKNTAEIVSFMSWPMTIEQAQDWRNEAQEGYKNKTDFLYIARDKENNAAMGCIGLHDIRKDNKNSAEVGYWLSANAQGNGYATEMLNGIIDLAFDNLKLASLCATVAPHNEKSQNLLEKRGFKLIGETIIPVAGDKMPNRNVFELKNPFVFSEK